MTKRNNDFMFLLEWQQYRVRVCEKHVINAQRNACWSACYNGGLFA